MQNGPKIHLLITCYYCNYLEANKGYWCGAKKKRVDDTNQTPSWCPYRPEWMKKAGTAAIEAIREVCEEGL